MENSKQRPWIGWAHDGKSTLYATQGDNIYKDENVSLESLEVLLGVFKNEKTDSKRK